MSDKKVVVYSSASGGTIVQKKTTEMVNIVQVLRGGKEVTVVWCDAEPKETREFVCKLSPPSLSLFIVSVSFLTRTLFLKTQPQVWGKSGKKGVYPLLFVNDEFLADVCNHHTLPLHPRLTHACSHHNRCLCSLTRCATSTRRASSRPRSTEQCIPFSHFFSNSFTVHCFPSHHPLFSHSYNSSGHTSVTKKGA